MERRKFIAQSGMTALVVGVLGHITWNQHGYIGNTATTTDLLGPFYRPDAPFRININPAGFAGQLFHIYGTVFREDGITPCKNCLIEIWQCDENREYDNTSDEFRFRGSQQTGKNGRYHFICMHPVPYPAGELKNIWRPAHIHMRISAKGSQDLITQVYLQGDPHLESDTASSSPLAINRILTISKNNLGEESVIFDVVLKKEYRPDDAVFEKLSGIYTMQDKSLMEFYREKDLLFLKWNGQIREGLAYKGNNVFVGSVNGRTTATFEYGFSNQVSVTVNVYRQAYNTDVLLEGKKSFKY